MNLSDKISRIPFSPIRAIFNKVNEYKAQGIDMINLGIGEPDFATPNHIIEAMYEATKKGATHYTHNNGIVELRKAICEKLSVDNNLTYDPEEIICTVGVSEAVYVTFSTFLNPGDEILVPDPSWLNYQHVTTLNDAKSVSYSITSKNNFQIDITELEAKISDKTKAIVLLDPSNPTGGIFSYETLCNVAEFAQRYDLLVISDEIYEKIIYDNNKHYSIASLPSMRKRTIVLNGFAKAYAMTGWRLGYIAAPIELIKPITIFHSYIVTSASSMVQWGGVAALKGTQEPLIQMIVEFEARRDYIFKEVNKIKGLACIKPKGAFYMFVDVSGTGMDGETFANHLLEHARVAVVPGTAFGKQATHEVRLSYATSMANIQKAMENIREVCEQIGSK
jgi:aminotransferase